MSLLLLQLSDLHVGSESDAVLARAKPIVDAVKDLDDKVAGIVIIFSGDLSYAGQESEFLWLLNFVSQLCAQLTAVFPRATIHTVAVPGNHDCDFSGSQQGRSLFINAVESDVEAPIDAAMVDLCTEVQKQFFDFRDAIARDGLRATDRLYYEYDFEMDGQSILFRCANTAWLSVMRESPGKLVFPVSKFDENERSAALVCTLFHHPYNWFTPANARIFRKRVERVSDIILTGHEHDFTRRAQQGIDGERNLYIEGAALQESHDQGASGFNAILVDLSTKRQRVVNFRWAGSNYSSDTLDASWEEYQVNRLRNRGDFEISDELSGVLDDLGMTVLHPARETPLSVADIFVFPDLREITYRPKELPRLFKGESIVGLAPKLGRLLITGAEKAGKSTLAKRLFRDFHGAGFVPLLIDGANAKLKDGDTAPEEFARLFSEQYRSDDATKFIQLDRARRVLIIDNYHLLKLRKKSLQGVLKRASHFAASVVLLANDVAHQVQEIVGLKPVMEGNESFTHFRIQQFGHMRRNELCEKWFGLDPELLTDEAEYARKLMQVKTMMDTAIGKNFIPSFPVILLPMLQAQQYNEQVNLNASTFGYFYELLIKRALAIGSTREAMDVKMGYLTFLAYALYKKSQRSFSEQEFRKIHGEYERCQYLNVSFAEIEGLLRRALILDFDTARKVYQFKYAYVFYYFVANHLKETIADKESQDQIRTLAADLFEEDNANILLFLAHLSKDPFIIDQMLENAAKVFSEFPRASLKAGEVPFESLTEAVDEIVFIERQPQEARKAILQRLDSIEEAKQEREALDESLAETNAYLKRISVAFKTQQILGQILKNFPGTIQGEMKKRLADECYGIGLRTLESLLASVRARTEEFVKEMVDTLRADDPFLDNEELSKKARESVFGLTHMACFGIIKRISGAVGSPHLGQIYALLENEGESPALSLITMALSLDQFGILDEEKLAVVNRELDSNPLARNILWSLVATHMNLFDVAVAQKQRLCAKLGMKYLPAQSLNPRTKLVSSHSSN